MDEQEKAFKQADDSPRLLLVTLLRDSYACSEAQPTESYAMLKQGCQHAADLGDRWWWMTFEFYRLAHLVHRNQDFVAAMAQTRTAITESRNTVYAGCPAVIALYDLVAVIYLAVDPVAFEYPLYEL